MKVSYLVAVLGAGLALAGCSTEMDGFGAKPSVADANRVLSAPTSSVETAPVAAPQPVAGGYGASASTAAAAVTPKPAVTASAAAVPLTPPPANPGTTAYAPSAAMEQLAGAWNFSWDNGRNSCPVSLSTDRGLNGLAAQADVSCPSEIFMTKGWDMLGSDLVLENHQGKVTARLKSEGSNRFVGVISATNQAIVLSR